MFLHVRVTFSFFYLFVDQWDDVDVNKRLKSQEAIVCFMNLNQKLGNRGVLKSIIHSKGLIY